MSMLPETVPRTLVRTSCTFSEEEVVWAARNRMSRSCCFWAADRFSPSSRRDWAASPASVWRLEQVRAAERALVTPIQDGQGAGGLPLKIQGHDNGRAHANADADTGVGGRGLGKRGVGVVGKERLRRSAPSAPPGRPRRARSGRGFRRRPARPRRRSPAGSGTTSRRLTAASAAPQSRRAFSAMRAKRGARVVLSGDGPHDFVQGDQILVLLRARGRRGGGPGFGHFIRERRGRAGCGVHQGWGAYL